MMNRNKIHRTSLKNQTKKTKTTMRKKVRTKRNSKISKKTWVAKRSKSQRVQRKRK